MEDHLIGRCGLYCGACCIHRAHKDGGSYLIRLAESFRCPPEKVRCEGCGALTASCWGNDCRIVQCNKDNGYRFCFECPKFEENSCEMYEELAGRYLEDNVDVRNNLKRIRSGETDDWLREYRERFRCPHCRRPLPEGSKRCYHCNREFDML